MLITCFLFWSCLFELLNPLFTIQLREECDFVSPGILGLIVVHFLFSRLIVPCNVEQFFSFYYYALLVECYNLVAVFLLLLPLSSLIWLGWKKCLLSLVLLKFSQTVTITKLIAELYENVKSHFHLAQRKRSTNPHVKKVKWIHFDVIKLVQVAWYSWECKFCCHWYIVFLEQNIQLQ